MVAGVTLYTPEPIDGGRAICTTSAPRAVIPLIFEGVGRLKGGKVVVITALSEASMVSIVEARATRAGLDVPSVALQIIAAESKGDVRKSVGAICRIKFRESLRSRRPSVAG